MPATICLNKEHVPAFSRRKCGLSATVPLLGARSPNVPRGNGIMSTTDVGVVAEIAGSAGPGEETLESALDKNKTIASSKIMIVDDEPINVKVARKYLKLEGYENFVHDHRFARGGRSRREGAARCAPARHHDAARQRPRHSGRPAGRQALGAPAGRHPDGGNGPGNEAPRPRAGSQRLSGQAGRSDRTDPAAATMC